jgi:hypothetical protein
MDEQVGGGEEHCEERWAHRGGSSFGSESAKASGEDTFEQR